MMNFFTPPYAEVMLKPRQKLLKGYVMNTHLMFSSNRDDWETLRKVLEGGVVNG